jgi:hypothetical protein
VPVLLTQAIPASVSWPQQVQPAGVCRILSVPTERSSAERLRTGGADRKTLRLPRCLRRGGMRAFGWGH